MSSLSTVLSHQDPTASKVVPKGFIGVDGAKLFCGCTAQFYDLENHLK